MITLITKINRHINKKNHAIGINPKHGSISHPFSLTKFGHNELMTKEAKLAILAKNAIFFQSLPEFPPIT